MLAAVFVLMHATVAAQEITIGSTPACRRCTIELEPVVAVGTLDGPGAIGRPRAVARDSRGQVYVVSEESPASIVVFDPGGRYLRTIGRAGSGPGEFRSIGLVVVAPGETLHVFDDRNLRRTVIDPSGALVREDRITGNARNGYWLAGRIVAAGRFSAPEHIGHPIHLLGSDSEVQMSFGTDAPLIGEEMFYLGLRSVSPSRRGHVWAAHHIQYVVEEWTLDNRRLRRIVRDASWFPPQTTQRRMTRDVPEYPVLRALREDERGRLWTLSQVAEPEWWLGLGEPVGSSEGRYYPITDIDRSTARGSKCSIRTREVSSPRSTRPSCCCTSSGRSSWPPIARMMGECLVS